MKKALVLLTAFAVFLAACCGSTPQSVTPSVSMITFLDDATAALVTDDGDGDLYIFCSAVWISPTDMLTAAHCVRHFDPVGEDEDRESQPVGKVAAFITWRDSLAVGDKILGFRKGTVVSYDPDKDLAVISTTSGVHGYVALSTEPVGQGDAVHIVGHTLGLGWSYSPGFVGSVRKMPNTRGAKNTMIQVWSAASFGNSGGGVFNSNGQLVGIASFMMSRAPLVFFTSAEVVKDFLGHN